MSILVSETLAEALADLYEVVRPGTPAAAHFRQAATEERLDRSDIYMLADDIAGLLETVPDPKGKHGHNCHGTHAACLADRIAAILHGYNITWAGERGDATALRRVES